MAPGISTTSTGGSLVQIQPQPLASEKYCQAAAGWWLARNKFMVSVQILSQKKKASHLPGAPRCEGRGTHPFSSDAGVGDVPVQAQEQLRRASPDLRRAFRTRYVLQLGRNTGLSNRNHHPHEARRTKYQCFPAPDMCVPHLLSHTKNSFYFFPFGNNKPRFECICFQ